MDFLWDSITEWLKELLVGGIISNLSGMFDHVNQKVGEISTQVGTTPQGWNSGVFSMVQNLSETVIVPIAGMILAFVMTLELIQLIIDKNNLNDVDPKPSRTHYGKWLGDKKKLSFQDKLRLAIDAALAEKPKDYDDFLKLMKEAGYEYKDGKQPGFRGQGQKKFTRLRSLKDGYSQGDILSIIVGKKELSPARKEAKKIQAQRVNLLVDIQAKLAEGKGDGYARWAQSFNLKQMASTLNFLTERKLLDYGTLCKKTDEVTARFHELSDQIKAAETRMAEIAVMKKHIINYAKTREVYVAYRKAGYSKKFLAEHEADILLHKAAKKAFDEMGVKKLPTVKSLQAEYAALLSEKKKLYPEYSSTRQEMRDLQMARANVARLMGYDEKEQEQKKEQKKEAEQKEQR